MTRVMFVDDEPAILRALARAFRSRGVPWQSEFVTSGYEALDLLSKQTFDVVVADMRIPDLSGIELLEQVQRQTPGVARLILSGQIGTGDCLDVLRVAHQCLAKPCSVERLHGVIEQITWGRCALDGELATAIAKIPRLPSPITDSFLARDHFEVFGAAGKAAFVAAVREHALVVGGIARAIAPSELAHDAYVTGLLHEIGKLALVSQGRDPDAGAPQAGGYLLALWGVARPIVEAIAYQDDPSRAGALGSILRSARLAAWESMIRAAGVVGRAS